MIQNTISQNDALEVGNAIGIDWNNIDVQQFRRGLEIELEHGLRNENSNITDDDIFITGKIAMAHLNELSDYYTRLDIVENTKFKVEQLNNETRTTSNTTNQFLVGAAVGIGLFAFVKYLKSKK